MSLSNTYIATEHLNSELLRTFLVVAETGSFSKAATHVFRSQSAVSLQIKQLEELLEQPLFDRHARGVELSIIGEKLVPSAQQVINLLDQTMVELKANPLRGKLSIGIPNEFGESFLATVIGRFTRDNPGVELTIQSGLSANFPAALKNKELDLAVHAVDKLTPSMHLLRQEKLHWVESGKQPVHQLKPVPVAVFDRSCWWREITLDSLNHSQLNYQIVFNSESVGGISAAISSGIAVGVLAESSINKDFAILSNHQGFPTLPDSFVVVESRENLKDSISQTMIEVIRAAFARPMLS